MNKQTVLSKHGRRFIIDKIAEMNQEMRGGCAGWRNYKLPKSDYVDKILAFNELFCHKCMEVINVGDHIHYTKGGSVRVRHYYHNSCYERMHY